MNEGREVAVIIPSLEPDKRLVDLVCALRGCCENEIVVVDDGSGPAYRGLFDRLESELGCHVLRHDVNQGKGRALKTAFAYFLEKHPDGLGVVTADSDGQHRPGDILKVIRELEREPESLVLGVRDFSQADVPFKSRFGNNLTKLAFRLFVGLNLTDTQTGLRGVGAAFMRRLLQVPGERFEYETKMLMAARDSGVKCVEVVISTVYLEGNKSTHFHPIRDSWKIYKVILGGLLGQSALFALSGLLSAGLDLALFALFFYWVMPWLGVPRLIAATIVARALSSILNYLFNRNVIFKHGGQLADAPSLASYYLLCVVIMLLSYSLVRFGLYLKPPFGAVWVKALVDSFLFLVSFLAQKWLVFHRRCKVEHHGPALAPNAVFELDAVGRSTAP